MAFEFNGTTILGTGAIKYNGISLSKLIYNGTTVWIKALNLLSSTYFTADDCVTVNSSAVKVTNNGGQGVTITKYSKNFTNSEFAKLEIGGNYYIGTDSSVTSYMTVTLETSSGTVIATLLDQRISGDNASRSDNFSKSVNISSYKGQSLRLKFVLYHRYEFRDYINITKLELHD